jgi:ATP-dependent DNA helicase RecQ
LSIVAYHAGMEEAERTRAQDEFMTGRTQMIVATNAFGMGIDKADIRFVAHYQMPGSIEAYYQEIGRAGRDGLPSTCVLFFNYADKRTQDYFIEGSYPPPDLIAQVYQALVATGQKRIELSVSEIATRASLRNEMAVQSALIILEKAGHIERGAAGENRASIRLLMPPHKARAALGERETKTRQALFALLGGYDLSERADAEIDVKEFSETAGLDLAAARRALASLQSSEIISYTPARRTRGVLMLDEQPVRQLRIAQHELARRAALEQRKLREMINFCYIENCYRAFILDYFGDRHHAPVCGTCGNCLAREAGKSLRAAAAPQDPPTNLDRFVRENAPVGLALEDALNELARVDLARVKAEAATEAERQPSSISVTEQRALTSEESLLVRKILACAARMRGRFGKAMIALVLRGSRARNVLQAGLDKLTTYGILDDMTQDELMLYIDALVAAGCLQVTGGAYPTVSLSKLGDDVMRERANVELALPSTSLSELAHSSGQNVSATIATKAKSVNTIDETYALYCEGLSVEEISRQRNLTEITIEKHLADCILEGRDVDVSRHVTVEDRALIEEAISHLGTERLRPLRDALPAHISYRMIRFVAADLERAARAQGGLRDE